MPATILILEDERGLRASLTRTLERRGHEVLAAATVAEARAFLAERRVDLMLADIRLPDGSGLEALAAAREADEELAVVMMTAFPDVDTAVKAMQQGARDLIVKPFELSDLHRSVARLLETRELRRDVQRLKRRQTEDRLATPFLGSSAAMAELRGQIAKVAGTDTPVLIAGETGSGKELVARTLHDQSTRHAAALIAVNCSAFSPQLLESELFGHEKGAFTDAREARAGLFEMADGGTLFLDEVAEMPPELQAKFLRVLEGHPYYRLGGQRQIRANVRIIAASNRDLRGLVDRRRFREDLYFRLNVFRLEVPPLRARGQDIVELARHFLGASLRSLGKAPAALSPEAEEVLLAYPWPGNVRELRNVLERAAILCEGESVSPELLPGELRASSFLSRELARNPGSLPSLTEVERLYIAMVLESVDQNISAAARILGIARNTLKARIKSPPEP